MVTRSVTSFSIAGLSVLSNRCMIYSRRIGEPVPPNRLLASKKKSIYRDTSSKCPLILLPVLEFLKQKERT